MGYRNRRGRKRGTQETSTVCGHAPQPLSVSTATALKLKSYVRGEQIPAVEPGAKPPAVPDAAPKKEKRIQSKHERTQGCLGGRREEKE